MVPELNVKLIFILLFVFVLLVYKATHLLHVLKQDVAAIMSVLPMKSVTMLLVVASVAKNASHFVIQAIVPEVLIVLPGTIRRPADVNHPY